MKLRTNEIVAELMDIPRPSRRRIQEILRIVHKDGRKCGQKYKERIASIKIKSIIKV